MDNFYSYEKMPESLSKLGLDLLETKKLEKATWVVTEKIHGANFSFLLSAEGIGYAKRKEPLAWTDDFFGFQLPATELQGALYQLYDLLRAAHPDLVQAQLYGELFGGAYPHTEVAAIDGLQAIQTGIYYCPDIRFIAFDLAWIDQQATRHYLPYSSLLDYCEAANIPHAKPLLVGSLQQALNFNIRFNSLLPAQLGFPALQGSNLIEGIVVKPFGELELATNKGLIRPILKIKNPEFSESDIYGEAQKWSFQLNLDVDAAEFYAAEMQGFINKNRLQNAISKIGPPNSAERKSAIRQLVWEDVLESFQELNPSIELEQELIANLKRILMPYIRALLD